MKRINLPTALLVPFVAAALALPQPAGAQADPRLERIEAQLRALQRTVFQNENSRFFEPEIANQAQAIPQNPSGNAGNSTLTDVLARLDAIETQLARLTAATEVNENALRAIETRLNALEGSAQPTATSGPRPTPTPSATPAPSPTPTPTRATPTPTPAPTPTRATPAPTPAPAPAPTPTPTASGPTAERLAAVQAIIKPATSDAGEDEYSYGFRLWDAGFYPEAQQQLALFLERHPSHSRATYGRNLLGRAFLDAGDARSAATHFFANYQANKQADRAPDSLLYLADSMIRLNDTRRACIALAEFGETYPALATGRLKSQYDTLSGRVTCN